MAARRRGGGAEAAMRCGGGTEEVRWRREEKRLAGGMRPGWAGGCRARLTWGPCMGWFRYELGRAEVRSSIRAS